LVLPVVAVEYLIKIESHARSREGGLFMGAMISPTPLWELLASDGVVVAISVD
jgi:hypothetical protein